MPPSESHESLVEQLLEVMNEVPAALDSKRPDALQDLAARHHRIAGALTACEPEAGDLQEVLHRLVHARDRIQETRAALQHRRSALHQERQVLDTRQKVNKAYGAPGSS